MISLSGFLDWMCGKGHTGKPKPPEPDPSDPSIRGHTGKPPIPKSNVKKLNRASRFRTGDDFDFQNGSDDPRGYESVSDSGSYSDD